MKKHKVEWGNVIVCRDTRRKDICEIIYHPEYKANHDTTSLTGLGLTSKILREVVFDLLREKNVKCIRYIILFININGRFS